MHIQRPSAHAWMLLWIGAGLAPALLLAACGGGDTHRESCGEQGPMACECPDGTMGQRTCARGIFSECSCATPAPVEMDAGSGGFGNTDADIPMSTPMDAGNANTTEPDGRVRTHYVKGSNDAHRLWLALEQQLRATGWTGPVGQDLTVRKSKPNPEC